MKIIDLLNIWVKDRNKLPEKIKIDNKVFEYNKECNLYKTPDEDCYLIQNYLNCVERLYGEVEVTEENEEIIEELPNELMNDDWQYYTIKFYKKINELVQAVNKINKQLEEQETEDIETAERELNKIFKERGEK